MQYERLEAFKASACTGEDVTQKELLALAERLYKAELRLVEETQSADVAHACFAQLNNNRARRRGIMSCRQRLPTGILSQIFGEVVKMEIKERRSGSTTSLSFASLTLSHVFARWRSIIHGEPKC